MSQPRRRKFGPLFYATLVVGALATAFVAFEMNREKIQGWQRRGYLADRVAALEADAGNAGEDVRISAATSGGMILRSTSLAAEETITPELRAKLLAYLDRLVADKAGPVRVAAINALQGTRPGPELVKSLVSATGDEDRAARRAAALALQEINGPEDPDAFRALFDLAMDAESRDERASAAQLLTFRGRGVLDRAVAAFTDALSKDKEPLIRLGAVDSLGGMGPPARAAIPALEKLLGEEDLRYEAADAIVRIAGKEAPDTIIAIVIGRITDPALGAGTRQQALETIRGVKPEAEAKIAAEMVRQFDDEDPDVRNGALNVLIDIVGRSRVKIPIAGEVGSTLAPAKDASTGAARQE